jgi:hypothetical protein
MTPEETIVVIVVVAAAEVAAVDEGLVGVVQDTKSDENGIKQI